MLLAFSFGPFLQSQCSSALLEFASTQSWTCLLPLAMLCACWRDDAAMLMLALVVGHRWVKNMNQGTEGSEVDDLLQLSYLQRLARQKVAEMEVPLFHLPSLYALLIC